MEGIDRETRAETATAPDGVVHDLATPNKTVCGQVAGSWSKEVTALQAMGLVAFCKDCAAGPTGGQS